MVVVAVVSMIIVTMMVTVIRVQLGLNLFDLREQGAAFMGQLSF